MMVVLDYSSSFHRPDLEVILAAVTSDQSTSARGSEEEQAKHIAAGASVPEIVDFSRKDATVYLFKMIHSGSYTFRVRERFKKNTECQSAVTLTIRTWSAGKSHEHLVKGGIVGTQLYQSMAELDEHPREAQRLPINLNTYKYIGAELKEGNHASKIIFSGPIKLDEREQQNYVVFEVTKPGSFIRVYIEMPGAAMTLEQLDNGGHPKTVQTSSNAIAKIVEVGKYRIKITDSTKHGKKKTELLAREQWMTIAYADGAVSTEYEQGWSEIAGACPAGAAFPLALRQQKQADIHQLYYNYPFIKVDEKILNSKQVLQTYNFRVNVTSRAYFAVGSHLISRHATLQLSALGSRQWSVQGKQRGNLNTIDAEVSPGDYALIVKQPFWGSSAQHFGKGCGLFSLEGLLEGLNLMKSSAKSGSIAQRGLSDGCLDGDVESDVLPSKIYADKSHTRGGGELHLDASGVFNKKFRDVLFRQSLSDDRPEYDRMELEVVEDAMLHLTFALPGGRALGLDVVVADTLLNNQEITPINYLAIPDISGNIQE